MCEYFFHLIRNSDETDVISIPDFEGIILNNTNKYFSPHNITFNYLGHDFIDNSDYKIIENENEFIELTEVQDVPNAINVYIVSNIYNGWVGATVGKPSRKMVIRRLYVTENTFSHELGHCLYLYHTHETSLGVESKDGSNCAIAGDLICDTPADPGLDDEIVNSSCLYTGGGGYYPDTHNIMSYTQLHCMSHFTHEQGNRMRQALDKSRVIAKVKNVTNVTNQDIIINTTLSSRNCDMSLQNINISDGVELVIHAGNSISIDGYFFTGVNAKLNIDNVIP